MRTGKPSKLLEDERQSNDFENGSAEVAGQQKEETK